LSQIAKVLALSPDRCVIVEGHTDSTGNYDKNMSLSRDRANSVVNFITVRNGIDRRRLVPVGKGSSDPMPNLDSRDSKNRRVVFKVVTG
jgi:outer membrane protein OmpA-like peptidoglycan-associated protein